MIGGSVLRDIGAFRAGTRDVTWQARDSLSANEQVWECSFDGERHPQSFLVTVIFDSRTRAVRSLYTAHTRDIDRLPRIPISIRRSVELFIQSLHKEADQCA